MKTIATSSKNCAMRDAGRTRLTAALASAIHRVNTRARGRPKRGAPMKSSFISLVVPDSDFTELRARAEALIGGSCSEHAATLAAAMRTSTKMPAI